MSTLEQTMQAAGKTFDRFTERTGALKMRAYQLEPARAILASIRRNKGLTFVVVISRQAGKDEMLVNLIAYLMKMKAHREEGIVIANPTYKPQTVNFIVRLERRLSTNLHTRGLWRKRTDFMRILGGCVTSLLSGDKEAKVVGATASLLLVINEAQDITPAKYDKDFEPMAASTNATRVIVGTEWTTGTLLAREEDAALELEKQDGIRRVFKYTSEDVRKVNAPYGAFVDEIVRKRGRQHPLVKTQYFCERIDAIAGMFNARRMALMQGDEPAQETRREGTIYITTIDVGGVDEAMLELDGMGNPGRDKTTVNITAVDFSSVELLQAPTYRVVHRYEWQGVNHVDLFGAISALIDNWGCLYIVQDATGVGEGLFSMMSRKYRERAIGVKFTGQSKSEMGYAFLGMIEAGRFRDCAQTAEVREQYENCTSEIMPGPQHTMRWGVKDGTRNANGELIHDDYILADALTTELDKLDWSLSTEATIIEQEDILEEMSRGY